MSHALNAEVSRLSAVMSGGVQKTVGTGLEGMTEWGEHPPFCAHWLHIPCPR